MKKIFLFTTMLISIVSLHAQSVYDQKVKSLTGDSISISQFAGKKTLFIIVALNQQDAVFQQIQAFKARYADSINIVGIVSKEDGYQPTQQTAVSNLYTNMGFVLTEGIYTRKTSGANQAPLMQWLTQKEKNRHFNNDASGVGTKFFVSEGGRLYAVLPPQTSLQIPLIDRIVHSNTSAEHN